MSTFQAISLMLSFGLLLISLLAYIDRQKKK
ncbi:MAG: putative holin-like toxin [Eubacteriales bacterium]